MTPQMDSSIIFTRLLQCALWLEDIGATWGIWLNLSFLWPTPCPQPKRQIDQFSRFCTAHGRWSLYFTMGASLPQNCPTYGGHLEPKKARQEQP